MASIIFKIPARYGKRRSNARTAYNNRDEILLKMGFASYSAYLRSPLWQAIRSAKLAVDPKCELCPNHASQVHHIDYGRQTLKGRKQHKLVGLCGDCHLSIELRPDGTKRNFMSALSKLRRKLSSIGGWLRHTKRGQAK